MISDDLQFIFLISISVSIAHNLEEYIARHYEIDVASKLISKYLKISVPQGTHHLFQIIFWILLAIFFLIFVDKWPLWFMPVFGTIYIFEMHHFLKSFTSWKYSPGLITAFFFPVVGFFFWKALINSF
ncbi:HXXEE domain-containing protein [Candidatus Woesearchaeota archaeon]|nr:HXXEE domain-containing protein [Candidatus Woesearchaeota archaeon]